MYVCMYVCMYVDGCKACRSLWALRMIYEDTVSLHLHVSIDCHADEHWCMDSTVLCQFVKLCISKALCVRVAPNSPSEHWCMDSTVLFQFVTLWTSIHSYTHAYIHTQTHTHTHTYVHIQAYIHACMHT
jgi:hypothetical protein